MVALKNYNAKSYSTEGDRLKDGRTDRQMDGWMGVLHKTLGPIQFIKEESPQRTVFILAFIPFPANAIQLRETGIRTDPFRL